jgi:hypothetical protein
MVQVKPLRQAKQINKTFHCLTDILSNTLWAWSRTHHKSRTWTQKLKSLIRWLKNKTDFNNLTWEHWPHDQETTHRTWQRENEDTVPATRWKTSTRSGQIDRWGRGIARTGTLRLTGRWNWRRTAEVTALWHRTENWQATWTNAQRQVEHRREHLLHGWNRAGRA